MRFLTLVLIVAALAGLGWAFIFGPYYVDAWKMQDVVGSAALSWDAFNEDKGHQQLANEMKRREIPDYLTVEECTFFEDPDKTKVVDCDWYVDVYPPLVQPRRLKFRVVRGAKDGHLEER